MNKLTIEQQKKLTEFLGDEWILYECVCSDLDCEFHHLDFSDWRVVGMLIEKSDMCFIHSNSYKWFYDNGSCIVTTTTPQLAICRAVLAYLEGKP